MPELRQLVGHRKAATNGFQRERNGDTPLWRFATQTRWRVETVIESDLLLLGFCRNSKTDAVCCRAHDIQPVRAALFACAWQLTCSSPGMMVIIKSHLTSPPDGGLRARHLPYLMHALLAALFFVGSAFAQDRPAVNEFTTWFGGQFANKHAFSD